VPLTSLQIALSAAALGLVAAPPAAIAQQADPAVGRVETFNQALIDTMKAGKAAGMPGREAKVRPAIQATFDLPTMTRYSVGPGWNNISPAQRDALIKAFGRMTVAAYARNFDSWSGERIVVQQTQTRGPDKLVQTSIIKKNGDPVTLAYRMRQIGGQWKVIDVYYKSAVSELTTRRSDFASILAKSGPDALVKHLDELAAKPETK
jgi:phospholipid transport system substrate-binding protein